MAGRQIAVDKFIGFVLSSALKLTLTCAETSSEQVKIKKSKPMDKGDDIF
jgi:hypothetical protein